MRSGAAKRTPCQTGHEPRLRVRASRARRWSTSAPRESDMSATSRPACPAASTPSPTASARIASRAPGASTMLNESWPKVVLAGAEHAAGGAVGDLHAAVGIERNDERVGAVEGAPGARPLAPPDSSRRMRRRWRTSPTARHSARALARVELDQAHALVAEGDRERGAADEARAARRRSASAIHTAAGTPTLGREAWPAANAAADRVGQAPPPRHARRPHPTWSHSQRRPRPAAEIAAGGEAERLAERGQHAVTIGRLQAGGEMVPGSLLDGGGAWRATDARAIPCRSSSRVSMDAASRDPRRLPPRAGHEQRRQVAGPEVRRDRRGTAGAGRRGAPSRAPRETAPPAPRRRTDGVPAAALERRRSDSAPWHRRAPTSRRPSVRWSSARMLRADVDEQALDR